MKKSNLILTACVFLLVSCATQKSRKDQSALGKIYHNVTSKYNGYFNATVLLEEGIAQLEGQYQDDYNRVLPLYSYMASENPESVASNMDEAIKKVSIVATLHENSQWTDDCYLLIGKAYFIKQDYESAENALEFFSKEFNPDGTRVAKGSAKKSRKLKKSKAQRAKEKRLSEKERKRAAKKAEKERKAYNKALKKKRKKARNKKKSRKKDDTEIAAVPPPRKSRSSKTEKPPVKDKKSVPEEEKDKKPGALKHKPAYQEAILWLARTYIERDNFNAAKYQIAKLDREPILLDAVKEELPVVKAHLAMRQNDLPKAIVALDQAIALARKKDREARLLYIKAQLLDQLEQHTAAYDSYAAVVQSRPDYEMRFNAELNMAISSVAGNGGSMADSEKVLKRMLKDEKNEDFLDQVYFALAQIAIEKDRIPEAITYLQQSVENSTRNASQKTESNYLMAMLHFEAKAYVEAKAAFDATLQSMSEQDDRFKQTKLLSENLTDIAIHLETIALQDSLLRLSTLSPEELKALAREIRKKQEQEALAMQQKDLVRDNSMRSAGDRSAFQRAGAPQVRTTSTTPRGSTQSTFFAFDEKTLKRSKREFDRTWGERQLTDYWRLSSRTQGIALEELELEDAAPPVTDAVMDDLFGDVPATEEAKEAAREKIKNAMLQLGSLYRDKLESPEESVTILEDLIQTYPGSKYELDALYQLYLSYLELGQNTQAERIKDRIIRDYASSKFAMALSDPDYLQKQLTKQEQIYQAYDQAYAALEGNNATLTRTTIANATTQFGTDHDMQPKFALLDAMATGKIDGKESYINALKNVVAQYPNTPEATKAKDMLLLLGVYKPSSKKIPQSSEGREAKFKDQQDAIHFILVEIINFTEISTRDSKIAISTYNKEYHKLEKLKISSLVIDPKTRKSLILIRTFQNADKAMGYREGVLKNAEKFLPAGIEFEIFPVTQHNYREVIKQRSLDEYGNFFEEAYQ